MLTIIRLLTASSATASSMISVDSSITKTFQQKLTGWPHDGHDHIYFLAGILLAIKVTQIAP
jgi:hypothetical protein